MATIGDTALAGYVESGMPRCEVWSAKMKLIKKENARVGCD